MRSFLFCNIIIIQAVCAQQGDSIIGRYINQGPLYKYYIYTEALAVISRAAVINAEINVRRTHLTADYLRLVFGTQKVVEYLSLYPDLPGEYIVIGGVAYVMTKNKRRINYELDFGISGSYGDPNARLNLLSGNHGDKFSLGLVLETGFRYTFNKIPVQLRLVGSAGYNLINPRFIILPSVSLGYGFKRLSLPAKNNKNKDAGAGSGLISRKKDSLKYYDYYLLLNFGRTLGLDVGIERIKPLTGNLSYAVQLSLRGGGFRGPRNYYNPKFIFFCFQPFHLLAGKKLKFETGLSGSLRLYRNHGKPITYPGTSLFLEDELVIIYSVGLRYTFIKPQMSLKLIVGPGYSISLNRKHSSFVQAQTAEIGISWRIRKKIKKSKISFKDL